MQVSLVDAIFEMPRPNLREIANVAHTLLRMAVSNKESLLEHVDAVEAR
jgi:hypothetical protein